MDITDRVYTRDPITITRGKSAEGAEVDPASLTLTLNNRDGHFSPRNPLSPYYGLLGRNTPIRVYMPSGGEVALDISGASGERVTCPDSSALDITTAIDVRVDMWAEDWHAAGNLIGKYSNIGDERSWAIHMEAGGRPIWYASTDGSLAQRIAIISPTALPPGAGRRVLRVTYEADNGIGLYRIIWYYGPTMNGPWTELDAWVSLGPRPIHAGAAPIEIGDIAALDGGPFPCRIYEVQIRNGYGGTIVANPVFADQSPGEVSFADDQGNTWTVDGASVTDRAYRFVGEVASWPQRWDVSGADVYVPIEAAGILRRLSQGAKPLQPAATRALGAVDLVAWWPMDDEPGAEWAASAVPGQQPMQPNGEVEFTGSAIAGLAGSVRVGEGGVLSASILGGPDVWAVGWWLVPPDSLPDDFGGSPLVEWYTPAGAIHTWTVHVEYAPDFPPPILVVTIVRQDDSVSSTSVPLPELEQGQPIHILISMARFPEMLVGIRVNGENRGSWQVSTGSDPSGPMTAIRAEVRAEDVEIIGTLAQLHVAHYDRRDDIIAIARSGAGWSGETAVERIRRIATEEAIGMAIIGESADSEQVGPQEIDTALSLMREAAEVDGGTLYELRDASVLAYRTRASDYNQTPSLTLDYSAGEIAPQLEPVDDDQRTRNDVIVTRRHGSSARAVQESGPLSVQPPPHGVGRYDEQVELNAYRDVQLDALAGWRLHLGTIDEARYPTVRVNLAATPHLIPAVLATDVRSLIRLTNLPAWMPPGDVDLIVEGYREQIGPYEWVVEYACAPGSAWNLAHVEDAVYGRVDTDGSELAAPITEADTSISVAVTDGPAWVTDPAELPFDIEVGGEVMTVTAISGSSSPQTFTVIRSANGIAKAHAAGTPVRLANPAIVAL